MDGGMTAGRLGPPRFPGRAGLPAVVLATLLGCGRPSAETLPPVFPVSGSVRIDGQPLPRGLILMEGENDAAKGLAPVEAAIEKGSYRLEARAGRMRVRITAPEEHGAPDVTGVRPTRETVAAGYNADTTLSAEVSERGPNSFDFEVSARRR